MTAFTVGWAAGGATDPPRSKTQAQLDLVLTAFDELRFIYPDDMSTYIEAVWRVMDAAGLTGDPSR